MTWLIVSILFGLARVSGLMTSPSLPPILAASFKDMAHIWVGILIGGAFFAWRRDLCIAAVVLSLVELATFIATRGIPT